MNSSSFLKSPYLRGAVWPVLALGLACARLPRPDAGTQIVLAPERLSDTTRVVQSGANGAEEFRPAVAASELERQTSELFGAGSATSLSGTDSLEAEVLGGGDAAPTWDIEVRSYETYDRVRHYVELFSGSARERFQERLGRGTRYEEMVRAKLRAGDVPEDMYYLALIESGFNPHAYSRAAAVGMWQFMATTARGVGLRVDWWVDERRDPVRSTEAATRFLRGLREQFGSMYLAAAAYNGGPGRVARGLSRYSQELEGTTGDDIFFALAEKDYLRNETRQYVPQLIAAALVAKEPARYSLVIEQREPFGYDSARVGPRVPLAAVAQASGSSVAVIQELNPHILRGMTPPKDSMQVRIPFGTRLRFDSMFAVLPKEETAGARLVTAEKGATWASLAKKSGVSAKVVALYNPKVKPAPKSGTIAAGTSVLVPTAAVAAAALSVPDPSIERYGGASSRTHVVRRGENLSVIAKRYGTTPAAIMRLNRLQKPLIFPGQELLVRGSAAPATQAKTTKATAPKR